MLDSHATCHFSYLRNSGGVNTFFCKLVKEKLAATTTQSESSFAEEAEAGEFGRRRFLLGRPVAGFRDWTGNHREVENGKQAGAGQRARGFQGVVHHLQQ